MQNGLSSTMTPVMRSSSKNKIFERSSSSNLRSPQQLGQSPSVNSLINYRISQPSLTKGLGTQSRLRLEKENQLIKGQRDMSADTLQKRLDSFFASTRNFIYSATKMKISMLENIKDVDQQIDFNIKLFETDKQQVERCLASLESQLFNFNDSKELRYTSTAFNQDRSKTTLINRKTDDGFGSIQNTTENNYLNQMRRENRNLKYEMANLKEEINKIHIDNFSAFKSQDQVLISELESLKKQVTKIEKKASERKVCIKKLYSLLENKEKELQEFKNYENKYPISAIVNIVQSIKKYDTSKKMQNYLEMAVKEVKLNKLLAGEANTLSKQKKIEIEEMIHFLKVELKEITKYFTIQQPNNKQERGGERYLSPQPSSHSQQIPLINGFSSPNQYSQDTASYNFNGGQSTMQFVRSNGFNQQKQQQKQSIEGSALTSPTNLNNQYSTSSQNFYKTDNNKNYFNSQSKIESVSPANKQSPQAVAFNNGDFQYVLNEQIEYTRKKFLTHFVEMLGQINIHMDNLSLENQNDEAAIVLKLRDEFSKIANKHNGYSTLVQELRQRIEQQEYEIKERNADIENMKQKVIQIEENYKIEVKERNEEKRQLKAQVMKLEETKHESEKRERVYIEDIENLREQLFLVLDNLKSILEYFGILQDNDSHQDAANPNQLLDNLREYLSSSVQKVHLHKNVFEDMEKKILNSQDEIENLKYQNGELAKQIDDLDDVNRSLKDEIEILQLKNEQGDHLEQGIRDKIIQLQNENYILKKNQIDPEQLEKLESDKQQTIIQLKERNEAIVNMKIEIQDLESKVREQDRQIKNLSSELVNTEGEKTHQSKIVKSLEQYQIDKKAKHDEIIEKVIEMEKIQKIQNKEKLQLEEDVKRFKEREIKLEVQIEKLKKQADEKNSDILKTVKDLQKSNKASNDKIAEYDKQIGSLKDQITNLQQEINTEKNKINIKEGELKKQKEREIAQLEFSQQKLISQLEQEKQDAIAAEKQNYEREIQAIRHKDESEEFISEDQYTKLADELQLKNQEISQLKIQLQQLQLELQSSQQQNLEINQMWQADLQQKLQEQAIQIEERIEEEKNKIIGQFEKILQEQASQFEIERGNQSEAFEKEFKSIENKYKQIEEDNERENKKAIELSQMELHAIKESNEEYLQAIEQLKIEIKQSLNRENDLKAENENIKTKLEFIESNASEENKTIVNRLQAEKRQLEQNIIQFKRTSEQSESTIALLNTQIQKLKEENDNISLERSNLICELQAIKEQSNNLKQNNDEKNSSLEQVIYEKTCNIQELENEILNWQGQFEQLNEETKIITQENIQLNHKITDLQQQNAQKEKNLESLLKKSEEQIIQLKKEHQVNLEQVIHKSKGDIINSYNEQIVSLEKQIISLNEQSNQKDILLQQTIGKYEQQFMNQKKENQDKLENLSKNNELQTQQLAQQISSQYIDQINAAEQQINQLKEQVSQANNQNSQLISQKQNQIEQLEQNIEQNNIKSQENINSLKRDFNDKLEDAINKTRTEVSERYNQQIEALERQNKILSDSQTAKQSDQVNQLSQEINILNQQITQQQQNYSKISSENSAYQSEIEKLKQEIEELERENQKLQSANQVFIQKQKDSDNIRQESEQTNILVSQLQSEKQYLIDQNHDLQNQINQLNTNIFELEERAKNLVEKQSESKSAQLQQQQQEEVFDFEDFTDELASQHEQKKQDKEKKAELVPTSSSIPALGGLKLNLGGIQSNFENDADRIHIKRNLQDPAQPVKQQSNNPGYDSFDNDEADDLSQSKFKDQLIQEYGQQVEAKNGEIADLKQQIDYMFVDLEGQKGYILHLESMVEELKANITQLQESLQQQISLSNENQTISKSQLKLSQKTQDIHDDGSVSPNTRILNLKSKLADVEADHENDSINLNQQIINLKDENKKIKLQMQEIMLANDDLEARIEDQEKQILELQDNQHGEAAEEEIGQLHEQIDKLKQKVRRHEEDMAYLQQVIQSQKLAIDDYLKKAGNKQPGSESGQSKDDEDYEGGLVKELGKTAAATAGGAGEQFKQSTSKMQQVVSSYNEMQDQDFENDQEEDGGNQGFKKQKTLNTEEAEQLSNQLINEKIQIQQQIAELKNDFETIQTEDQIHIQELQRKLEIKKKQIQSLHEKSSNTNKQKHELNQLKGNYLTLQQQYKELKEENQKILLEMQNAQLKQSISPQSNSIKNQSSITNTEQIDMLKLSLADAQSQLKSLKARYNKGVQKIKSMIEAPSFSATQPAETEEDIIILAEQLANTHQQRILQLQNQNSEGISSHKSPHQEIDEVYEKNAPPSDITSLKAYVFYTQKLEAIIEEALLNKLLAYNEQMYKKDLTSEQFEKVQQYLRILNDFKASISEKQREYEELLEKVEAQAEEIEKLKKVDSTSNRNFLQKRSRQNSQQQQDPFQLNDFENIKQEIGENNNNNNNNESSFISMSEQIIKELEGANTKTPNQASLNQQSQVQKQQEEDLNKLMKENSELKASKDYYASRQDELFDELRAKEEIIQTTEQANKSLKKEIRKLKESTEAVSQKEHLKTIFIQFIKALSDKKKIQEAENFLGIIFSMLGITDFEKEDIVNCIAKKAADKKKSIIQILTQK